MNNLLKELEILKNNLDNLPNLNISTIDLSKTELFIIDMNNGFAKGGALYSPRIEALINPISNITEKLSSRLHRLVAFSDTHSEDCLEFSNYPIHCLENDTESEVIDELKSIENLQILPKNSTNGFFALGEINFDGVDNIIIVGDCTDICIYQFAVTLKTYFIHNNINKNIIVPVELVDTYDIPNVHCGDLSNIVFLNSMIQNGIKVVKNIVID
ncbi:MULTISPECIES: isochorismatase family cysteine hydrolase [unclassified Romboutsia]|uniref:isochorismatase family cysteine hydrolase n=1 Tax=unclassified Romboutsia TaxID=2626894 RepID=UPI0008203DF6|nr:MULTISPECIES: isochorismatase family cysteine hydrolase [unclassified Romboutsia]SCH02958.1 Isochorismatase family [uncultured Clostridium sp.]